MTSELSRYRGARVLVTGHTGFKGSWLALWLSELGAEVVGASLPAPTVPSHFELAHVSDAMRHEIVDLRDIDRLLALFQETRPEVVFHLGAQAIVRASYEAPRETFEVNVLGTVNVLECIRETESVRAAVLVTSDKCYENREWEFAYRENDPMGGHDPYSASKGAAEIAVAAYRRSFFAPSSGREVALATGRAGNVIGGGDWGPDRLVPDCVRALSRGDPILVRNPRAVRPWQHVLDALSGYLVLGVGLLERPEELSGAYNFGPESGRDCPVDQLVTAFVETWGSGAWEAVGPAQAAPHEARLLRLSSERAQQHLGWRTRLTTREAVVWAAEWYRGALDAGFERGSMAACSREQVARYMSLMSASDAGERGGTGS